MPEVVNTSYLGEAPITQSGDVESTKTMVKVEDVSMVFNMASETMNNLKEYAIALMRRELHFKEFRALDHVSLEVKKGDVFGILGTNGSGKSTLLKIIAGVLEPSEGTCTVNGGIAPLIELGAGFDMELTARENIYLNGALLGYSKKFIEQHFDEIVDFAEVEKFLDMPLKNYSSGMVARIAFAIATVIVPEILIVDEVLSVGDFMFQQKCERRIQSLIKEHGVTVLIVSHSNEQIERLCNKAVWIEKGHLRMVGSASEVCQVYRTLGGRAGSAESEKNVNKTLHLKVIIPENTISVISGENRYSTAVNIFEQLYDENTNIETIIIASGEDIPSAILASNMAAVTSDPLLLTRKDSLPDIVSTTLKQHKPENLLLIGDQDLIGENTVQQLKKLTGLNPCRISACNYCELANTVFKQYESVHSSTAILTYPDCTADLLSLAPYIASTKSPLFFNYSNGVISEETSSLLKDNFDRIIVLGGQTSFPDAVLEPLIEKGINIIRFCGKDPFDANRLIMDWIQNNIAIEKNELIIASTDNPGDALTITPFLCSKPRLVLLEDPRNLDSISYAIEIIKSNRTQTLTFLGNETIFSKLDKEILAKAAVSANQSY